MRRTFTLLTATAALAAGITGSASAATLYTTAAHTTPVAVGTTITLANTALDYYYNYYMNTSNVLVACAGNGLTVKVTQNSAGVFKANVTGGSFSGCSSAWTLNAVGALQISGSSITVGTNKAWLATTLTGTQTGGGSTATANYTSATGNPPVNGAWTQQPTAGAAPVTVKLDHAPTLTGPAYYMTTSAVYTITGGPATSYSLG
jgi:hypothetical protein